MKLRKFIVTTGSSFEGKTLSESGIRDKYNCMVVGVEEGEQSLSAVPPSRRFEAGDIVWVVGEKNNLNTLLAQ